MIDKHKGVGAMFKKILRIFFGFSFIPYLFLLSYSLYYAVFGYDVYTMILPQYVRTIYGWEAFSEVFLWTAIGLSFIPVLPICIIYQILYLILLRKLGRTTQSQ